jgi:hypothetical protein
MDLARILVIAVLLGIVASLGSAAELRSRAAGVGQIQ